MKIRSKYISLFLAAVMTFPLFAPTAKASYFDHQADILNDLGLIAGTPDGYRLEKGFTRAETAVMLVKFLGAEEEALTGTYTHPFTDVPDWADKQVGYMFEKGMTSGTSATAFSPNRYCNSRMYLTFLARALGYDEVSYESALTDVYEAGVLDYWYLYNLSNESWFDRDRMAHVSHYALAAEIKGSGKTLLEKLVETGAVSAKKAALYRNDLDAYALYRDSRAVLSGVKHMELAGRAVMNVTKDGSEEDLLLDMSVTAANLDRQDKLQMESLVSRTLMGRTESSSVYFKKGRVYTDANGSKNKTIVPEYDGEIYRWDLSEAGVYIYDIMSVWDMLYPVPFSWSDYKSYSVFEKNTDGTASFDMRMDCGSMHGLLTVIFSMLESAGGLEDTTIGISELELFITLDTKGRPSSIYVEGLNFGPTSMTMKLNCAYPETAPSIKFPDFSAYAGM